MHDNEAPWFQTASGLPFFLADPRPEDVDFDIVGFHLSKICRFSGGTKKFYSVAEHCVRGCHYASPRAMPYFLLHDAAESFSGDDTTPKKEALPLVMARVLHGRYSKGEIEQFKMAIKIAFEQLEGQIARAIHLAAGLSWPVPAEIEIEVKEIDRRMFRTEHRDLMPSLPRGYTFRPAIAKAEPYSDAIHDPWPWPKAHEQFVERCKILLPCFGGSR